MGGPPELITRHGAVSEDVVRAMAEGARARTGSTHALATTGIAGPGGGSEEKPVGTVWIAMSVVGQETKAWKENFPMDRIAFKHLATQSALDRLRMTLNDSH